MIATVIILLYVLKFSKLNIIDVYQKQAALQNKRMNSGGIDKARSVFSKRETSIAIFDDEAFRYPQATYAGTHIIQGRICAMWSAGLSAIFMPS